MIVVADTSPLNYLIRLGHSDILQELYGSLLVPQAVLVEMRHADAPLEVRAWATAPPLWVKETKVIKLDSSLPKELGMGESEAISLAIEVQADLLLIDERAGRHEAESRYLQVAGTLAVLLQASPRGRIAFPEALQKLRQCGFRVSSNVETLMLVRYKNTK